MSTADPLSYSLFQQQWPEGEYRMFQLGFVVGDLLRAARRWVDVFGVGPFHILPRVSNTCRYCGAERGRWTSTSVWRRPVLSRSS